MFVYPEQVMGVFRVLGVSNGHRGKMSEIDIMPAGHLMASIRGRRVRAKVSSGIFMMGRMMGNCFRTHHEALFLAKLLLPLLRQIQIRCCFMQHRIFYFLQKNPASTDSLRLLESQKIAFALAGVLAGNLTKNQYLFVLHGQERVLSRCTQTTANSKLSSVPRLVTKLVR